MHLQGHGVALALLIAFVPLSGRAQSINGAVRDEKGPWASATVTFTDVRGGKAVRVQTDAQGEFVFLRVQPAKFTLTVEKDGLRTPVGAYTIGLKEHLRIDVVMQPGGPPIAHVETNRAGYLQQAGFYDRMATTHGVFFVRDDFADAGKNSLSQILGNVRGVRVLMVDGSREVVMRSAVSSGYTEADAPAPGTMPATQVKTEDKNFCFPTVLVNGGVRRHASVGTPASSLDDVESPDNIEAIEVYQITDAPPQFVRYNDTCGVIALWSRRGN